MGDPPARGEIVGLSAARAGGLNSGDADLELAAEDEVAFFVCEFDARWEDESHSAPLPHQVLIQGYLYGVDGTYASFTVVRWKDDDDVKKLIVAVAALVGVGYLAKRFAPKLGDVDWEQRFAAMPDNAPPKWMFRKISEIHENTDRILELLEDRGQEATVGSDHV